MTRTGGPILLTPDALLAEIDREILAQLDAPHDDLARFYAMMRYHLGLDAAGEGGKRLRPLLCLVLVEGLGGASEVALPAAAAIELLHNFTLIHDDIEDQDRTRRHRPTVWAVHGVAHGINAGDGMYALSRRAVHKLRERGVPADRVLAVADALDRACVRVCEGQFLDLVFEARVDLPADRYREMVDRKTGALFGASAEIAGLLRGADGPTSAALLTFGSRFGAAFQARDDANGVWGAASRTGKMEMNDIAKRKMSLPIVLAVSRASAAQRDRIARAYARPAPLHHDEVRDVREIVDALDVRGEVERYVSAERERALEALGRVSLRPAPAERIRRLVAEATGARD